MNRQPTNRAPTAPPPSDRHSPLPPHPHAHFRDLHPLQHPRHARADCLELGTQTVQLHAYALEALAELGAELQMDRIAVEHRAESSAWHRRHRWHRRHAREEFIAAEEVHSSRARQVARASDLHRHVAILPVRIHPQRDVLARLELRDLAHQTLRLRMTQTRIACVLARDAQVHAVDRSDAVPLLQSRAAGRTRVLYAHHEHAERVTLAARASQPDAERRTLVHLAPRDAAEARRPLEQRIGAHRAYAHVLGAALAVHAQLHFGARLDLLELAHEPARQRARALVVLDIGRVGAEAHAVDRRDPVSFLQAGLLGGPVAHYRRDQHAERVTACSRGRRVDPQYGTRVLVAIVQERPSIGICDLGRGAHLRAGGGCHRDQRGARREQSLVSHGFLYTVESVHPETRAPSERVSAAIDARHGGRPVIFPPWLRRRAPSSLPFLISTSSPITGRTRPTRRFSIASSPSPSPM